MPWILAPALLEGLPILLAGIVLLALAETAKVWLEPTIAGTRTRHGGLFRRIADIPAAALRAAATTAFAAVTGAITVAASHRMRAVARWIHGGGLWLITLVFGVAIFCAEVAHAFERTTTVVIPREIAKATRPLSRRTKRAIAIGLGAAAAVARLRRYINHALHSQVFPQLHRLTHAVDVAIPRALGRLRARERALEREIEHPSTRWLRRIATAMFTGTILGLMLKALAKRFPGLFCRKVADKRTGALRRVCGMNQDLLDWVFAGTLLAMSPFTLEDFARQAVGTLDLFVEGLDTLLTDLHLAEADYLGGTSGALPGSFTDYLD